MSGLGEQRQRMSADAGHDQQHDVGQGHPQRDLQHPRRTARAMNVPVHSSSVRVDKTGFKRTRTRKSWHRREFSARRSLDSYPGFPHFSRGGSALMRPPRNLSRPRECRCGVQTGGRVAQTRPWVPKRNRTLARDLHHNQHPLGKDQFMDEIVKDFLIESNENLDRLDQELVKLESDPSSKELLASVFRTIHTIKGSCGFLGFARLEKLAHAGENLLSRLRDGKLTLTEEVTSGLLAMVDAVRRMLSAIQTSGQDGEEDYAPLIEHLSRLQQQQVSESAAPACSNASATLSAQPQAMTGENAANPEANSEPSCATVTPPREENCADPAKMGGLLVERGQVHSEDLARALEQQERGRKRIGEILVAQGAAQPEDVLAAQRTLEIRTRQWKPYASASPCWTG